MQKKRSIKIIAVVLIIVLICLLITYSKNDSKVVLATTKEFKAENLQDNEHMHVEIDNSGDKVPVPNGYVGSKVAGENEIDTGYVIYEGTEEVNDDNVEEAQKTRNQYVWVPVPDASTMYGTDENGKKWGKLYEFTTSTGNNIDPVTGTKPLNWSESDGVMTITNYNRNMEPFLPANDSDLYKQPVKEKSRLEFISMLEKDFNSMISSIEKYGGFYIGRYEASNVSKEITIKKYSNNTRGQNWYVLYNKCKNLKGINTNIETGMIFGSQWDRTLMWLIESENKTKEEVCNSSNWGIYFNTETTYTDINGTIKTKEKGKGTIIPTGSSEYTKANNIYDLAGNEWEWTAESLLGSVWMSYRGGMAGDSNVIFANAASRQSIYATYSGNGGCRAMLYIK